MQRYSTLPAGDFEYLRHQRKLRTKARLYFFGGAVLLVGLLAFVVLFAGGCMHATPATVNRDITTGIASAGSAAITAEAEYNAKTIPQTTTNRNIINGLGNAYNDARAAWVVVLNAEAAYTAAQNQQIAACTPATTPTVLGCTGATAAATAAKAKVDTANAALTAKVAALGSQTSAVQAITK